MSVSKIGVFNQISNHVSFKGDNTSKKTEYENPVNRQTERNLAILKATATSAGVGAVVGGLMTFLTKKNNIPLLTGLLAGGLTATVILPPALYNRKVSAFVKQKEMDVFSRDRNLKTNLTEEVDEEVQNPDVSLDKKLDDNLKLQMANRGAALGVANITSQQ